MTSLTAACPPRESHLMDEDRTPRRRTRITITVADVDPATGNRRDRYTVAGVYDRDTAIPEKAPTAWPPCACPQSRVRPCKADASLPGGA